MAALKIDNMTLLGVSKGPSRKAGLEQLWLAGASEPMRWDKHDPGLLLIQQIRDEAHRFAITGHRQRRDKQRRQSELQSIPGVGPKRRQALLRHFGGWQPIRAASVDEIAKVSGVNRALARVIEDAVG